MTQKELNKKLKDDPYFVERENPTEAEIRLYLREVNFHCPLCGTELQSRKQDKPEQKLFQIAHIYPNRPTIAQYASLDGVERMGNNTESFDNKIALCPSCHQTQDFRTTADDYNKLLKIKKRCIQDTVLNDLTLSLGLEEEIGTVIQKLTQLQEDELAALNYAPVPVANKFTSTESLLKRKIVGYVRDFYPIVRDELKQLEGRNGFLMDVLSGQIKSCFLKMNTETKDKTAIFNHIVQWVQTKSLSTSIEACEAVVAYFVQNCEVFYEITE